MKAPKVPSTPPFKFVLDPSLHVRTYSEPLWRVFRTEGDHPTVWDELRHFGPVAEMRFDPQPPPPVYRPDRGVMYTATKSYTALGETFQATRVIDRSVDGVSIAAWIPSRPLQLLDLTSNWLVLNNAAAAAMMMDDKSITQTWARAIYERLGSDLDGLYHLSSINNEPMITLFSRTEWLPAFPARVRFIARLNDSAADEIVKRAKEKLGYESV